LIGGEICTSASGYSDDAIVHEGHLDPGVALLKSHTGRQIWR
jgi:hypothetical protein